MTWWIAGPLLLAWLCVSLLATLGTALYARRLRRPLAPAGPGPLVAVLVPVKGAAPGLDRTLDLLAAQHAVRHRLLFAVESGDDPAHAAVARLSARTPVPVECVVAGLATTRGQKVHNLLAALSRLTPADEVVVFADADIEPAPDWLAQLVRPVLLGAAPLASGYNWLLPADARLPSRLAALMSLPIATAARSRRWNLCWGGSTALTRPALSRLDLPRAWDAAVSDDLVLTAAARAAGCAPLAPHRTLVPTPVAYGWRSLLAYARRQYLLVRLHAPRHWCLALLTLLLPVLAAAACLPGALRGEPVPLLALGTAGLLQQLRNRLRAAIAHQVLPPAYAAASIRALRRDAWLLPASHLLHLALLLSSAAGRTITWAGVRYRMRGARCVGVLRQPALVLLLLATALLPACAVLVSDKDGLPNPPATPEKGQVVVFAGFTFPGDTIIRSGMFQVAQQIRADGVRAEISDPHDWEAAARRVIATPGAARIPVAVVGYSLGGGAATKFAARLQQAGIPIDTLVVIEAFSVVPLACNVRHATDIYNGGSFLSMSSRIRPGPAFTGTLDQVQSSKLTEGRPDLNHWSIAFFDSVQRMVRDLVLDDHHVRHRPPTPGEAQCLAAALTPGTRTPDAAPAAATPAETPR